MGVRGCAVGCGLTLAAFLVGLPAAAGGEEALFEMREISLFGKKETLTAPVTYDTRDLYGKVQASWKIEVVASD